MVKPLIRTLLMCGLFALTATHSTVSNADYAREGSYKVRVYKSNSKPASQAGPNVRKKREARGTVKHKIKKRSRRRAHTAAPARRMSTRKVNTCSSLW